ncbi:MAG: CDP-alcohol phosphatidyltransferase family protein [Oscillospiraceae bacterium]|jgi:cardiolipin synthase|nr:CDP-alcohol phosphatidyltransferase family protein [Oscillospiraceae bacterium]
MANQGNAKRIVTVPNLLSAFRILLIPVIVWLYCGRADYPLAACVLVLSGMTDVADGFIARRFHMVSDLGKVLDPIADKLTQTAMLGCLLTRFDTVWWLLGVLVAKETAMAVMGLLVIRRTGGVYSAAWHGKLAACVLYAVIFTHIVWYGIPRLWSVSLVWLGVAAVLISLGLYVMDNLRRIQVAK